MTAKLTMAEPIGKNVCTGGNKTPQDKYVLWHNDFSTSPITMVIVMMTIVVIKQNVCTEGNKTPEDKYSQLTVLLRDKWK